jgi:2-polyprenyl-6-methoxyphenol hydroxylase-like FAD-dependent oxidoreductase
MLLRMKSPVVIVGAGPAGLVAALELVRRGVDVRIIERAASPSSGSRAKGLQPRTLEILESLGLIDEVLAGGGAFPPWRSYRGGRLAWEKSIYDLLGTGPPTTDPAIPYPQTWMVPQWRTERILRDALLRLGTPVRHGAALRGIDDDGTGVAVTLRHDTGVEHLRASYVIAADGASSTVRNLLGIPFEGVTREDERFVTADVRTRDLDRGYWHNWSHPADPAARVSICALPATGTFQFVAPLLPGQETPDLTLKTLQRFFDERSDGAVVTFDEAPWITVHRTNERLAKRYRAGRVFLVGDAAHALPAAGGQGLNTAVQDSHNLAWKLAAVLGGAPDDLLDTYEEERRPIAVRLMAGLDVADEDGAKPDIFQLRNHYRGRRLSRQARAADGVVRAGDRAPDAPLGPSHRLFTLARDGRFVALAFGDAATRDCATVAGRVDLTVLDVRRGSPATADTIGRIYGVAPGEEALFLIRPDGHVGFAAGDRFAERLHAYLALVSGAVSAR